MGKDTITTTTCLSLFLQTGYDLNGLKKFFQETIPKHGPKSFEFLATQKVLAELGCLLRALSKETHNDTPALTRPAEPSPSDESSESTRSEESSVLSAMGRWINYRPFYVNALALIQMIDPEKGAISSEYSEPLLELFKQKFTDGDSFGLESIRLLCHYSIMSVLPKKQLLKSFLAGAEKCLYDTNWSHTGKLLDFVRILDTNHHPEIGQKVQEIQHLLTERPWQPRVEKSKDLLILGNLRQLELLIENQETLHFVAEESHPDSWKLQGARISWLHQRRIRKQRRKEVAARTGATPSEAFQRPRTETKRNL